ncbi:probable Probable alanine aminotransferase [Saccharomycodes ludwigii]|uniref:Glutamate pyruvate transaminase n=1 Tax=Saccharomycodes ludwigii TaxID=36035 RepID=A0A376B0R6_9ASCO|nr:probable Probable alanine aminotransferase [Saccharomycodes ludwigii]
MARSLTSTTTLRLSTKAPIGTRLCIEDVNENVLKAKYAVRGPIPQRAEELKAELSRSDNKLPFKKIINANIGNPQQLGQKPLTFYREVLSLLQYPELIKTKAEYVKKVFSQDSIERAESLLRQVGSSVGAYSSSQGVQGFRETVAEFITKRDGEKAYADDIFLTGGASAAVTYILDILCKNDKSGVLIPIPQYPLYTATLALNNAHALPYYLNEEDGWSLDVEELENVILDSINKGIKPTCLVVINPGNPTGAVLKPEIMENIILLAAKYGLVIISDEVYQENVFFGKFHSMKQVLRQLQKKTKQNAYDHVQLASLHSTSKGVSGECGQRGGYMELVGFSDEIKQVFLKLSSISLCPVVTGQALVDLMVSPPKKGDLSYENDQKERADIYNALKTRSSKLWETFNNLEGISCQRPEGAMYLFPKIDIPPKAIKAAHDLNMTPDEFYCKELLENTGICTVPGSGFGQVPNTYHLRTTFLAPGTEWIKSWETFHKNFYNKYRD